MIRACPGCGASNRVPSSKLDKIAKCGACKKAIPAVAEPVALGGAPDFDDLVSGSPLPVLVDFWAEWCGPCHMVAPELEKLARENVGKVVVAKVDTDRVPDVAGRFGIRSIPTMILFRDGREAKRVSGAMQAADIARTFSLG
jgi:thioredoxin 2